MRRIEPDALSADTLARRAGWREAWLRRLAIIHVEGLETSSRSSLSQELAVAYVDWRRPTRSWLVLPEASWDHWLKFSAHDTSGEASFSGGSLGFNPKSVAFALAGALIGVTPYAHDPAPLMAWLDRLLAMADLEWRVHVRDLQRLVQSQRSSRDLLQQATAEVVQRYPASHRAARDATCLATLVRTLGAARNR
jgi:hypothetical protein